MYKQELKHKIVFEVVNDTPSIKIAIRFNDLFTQDTYVLVSENVQRFDKNNIKFHLVVNNKKQSQYIYLNNMSCTSFLNESFNGLTDYDFQELLTDTIKEEIESEIKDYIAQYERQIVLNEIGINGELHRMKELSGLKKKFLS